MKTFLRTLAAVGLAAGSLAAPVEAAAISLDGQFDDWAGQAYVGDPAGDSQNAQTDLQAFYFADTPGGDTAYFMAERWQAGSQNLTLSLQVDTNNDGNYASAADRRLVVNYNPNPNGRVTVDLYDGAGAWLKTLANNAAWGEAGGSARRVEWGVSFADLGIVAFQTIRVQLFSLHGSNVSDGAPEVQWSPANVLGWPLLVVAGGAGVAWLVHRRRRP
jgi:hypothetical protein